MTKKIDKPQNPALRKTAVMCSCGLIAESSI